MTPAEFHAVLAAKARWRKQDRDELDQLNAKLCEIVIKAPYVQDPVECRLTDFLIWKEEETRPEMTPDAILGRAFENLAGD